MVVPSCFTLRDTQETREHIESNPRPTLVYLCSTQSNLCKLIKPKLETMGEQLADRYSLIAVDVARESDPFHAWRIWQVPTFVLYREGEELRRLTNLEYGDQFMSRFKRFALQQFLFRRMDFSILNRFDFSQRIKEGSHLHLVAVMRPGQEANWELEPVLHRLNENHPLDLEIHLVNAGDTPRIMEWYDIDSTPSLLAFRQGQQVRRWPSIRNPRQLEATIQEMVA